VVDSRHTESRRPRPDATDQERLSHFLTQRLTEELGRLWARDRPGLASQLEVVDDVLRVLAAGRLPERHDLVALLVGYRGHPDFDPGWTQLR
jgi:hypothetical protein